MLKDMLKHIINTWTITIIQNRQYTYRTLISIICMVGQWVVTFLYLPYSGFKWLKNVDGFDVNSISETSPIGYILKVDLEYPNELHVLHNDYPLGLEKLAIPYATLSDCCKKIEGKYGIKIGDVIKLVPNLGDNTN